MLKDLNKFAIEANILYDLGFAGIALKLNMVLFNDTILYFLHLICMA